VLILLPPSEGKAAAPRTGRPVDLAALSLAALNPTRERVLDAVTALCAQPDPAPARSALGLGPTQDDDLRRNARLRVAATLPAARLYTGVLYEALDLASLDPAARRLAQRWILVFSGLWGALRLTDRVPSYRCPVGAVLPGVGGLTSVWRAAMPAAFAEAGSGPILDLRSGAYAAMWTPPAAKTVTVRVLHERQVDGELRRTPASHFNKATKGRLVRDLATAGARPRTPAALIAALRDLKYTVEEPAPRRLDLVVTQL
jgi:cytoplasmic iron level regulating protein YaaA (DUF328/UPF0246 family)